MAKFNGQFNGSWTPLESDGSISGGTGVPGPQGPAGPQGPKGEDGISPVVSVQNIVGGHTVVITDVSGTKTFDVMNGQDGMTGPQGPKGDEGPAGEKGAQGDPGLTGPEGPAGKDGEPGEQGPKGDPGDEGPRGEKGADGTSAGFGSITATINNDDGEPSVSVITSGTNEAMNLEFQFKNLNSESGGPYNAEEISISVPGLEGTNVQAAVQELFTSVSNGKKLIASAITDMGVETEEDASFQTMAYNIESIPSGGSDSGYSLVHMDYPEGYSGKAKQGMIYGNGRFLLFTTQKNNTSAYTILYSDDGETWNETGYNYSVYMQSAIFANDLFVFVTRPSSGNVDVHRSEDGLSWDKVTVKMSGDTISIAYGNDIFIINYVNGNDIRYSYDAIEWFAPSKTVSYSHSNIVFVNDRFVCLNVPNNKSGYYSYDGNEWTSFNTTDAITTHTMIYGKGIFFNFYNKKFKYSRNLLTWTEVDFPLSLPTTVTSNMRVCYANPFFIIVVGGANVFFYNRGGIDFNPSIIDYADSFFLTNDFGLLAVTGANKTIVCGQNYFYVLKRNSWIGDED